MTKDLQKAAEGCHITLSLRKIFFYYTEHHKKYTNKCMLSCSILDRFVSLSCQSWLGMSKMSKLIQKKTLTW